MSGRKRQELVSVLVLGSHTGSPAATTSRMSLPLCRVLPPPVPWPDQSSLAVGAVPVGVGALGQLHGGLLPVADGQSFLTSSMVISAPAPVSCPVNSLNWQVMKLPPPPPLPSMLTLFGDQIEAMLPPIPCGV